MAGFVSFVLLGLVIALVTLRPSGRTEVTFALPAALVVVVARLSPWSAVRHELRFLGPTLVFLAAVFVIAEVAASAGVFDAAGRLVGRMSASSPRRLVLVVALAATVTTTVLSLDATAVLLTPVVLRVTRAGRMPSDTALLTTAQLANGGSLLLPVSNLTNLLVFPLTGLTFAGFALRMALPLAAAAGIITAVLVLRTGAAAPAVDAGPAPDQYSDAGLDRFGRAVPLGLAALLIAFFFGSLAHVAPSEIAAGGARLLGTAALARRRLTPARLIRAASPGFIVFVGALGIVVTAATRHGLGDAPLLAALIGVNVGPNVTYTGSLATLLWRKSVRAEGAETSRRAFFTAAAIATPLALLAAVCALWLALRLFGPT